MSKSNFPNFPSSSNYRPLYFKTDFPQFSSGFFNMKGGDVSDDTAFLDTTIGEYINKNITNLFSKEKKYRLIPPYHLKSVEKYMVTICKQIIEYSKKEEWKAQEAYINRMHSTFDPKTKGKIAHDKIKHILLKTMNKNNQALKIHSAVFFPACLLRIATFSFSK